MTTIDPTEFWRDPESFRDQVEANYLRVCLPEYFFRHGYMSERIERAMLAYVPIGSSILELGCSVGRNLVYLDQLGYKDLMGVEINPKAVKYAREQKFKSGVLIAEMSLQKYLAIGPLYDVIFTQSVLMHIPSSDEMVFELMAKKAKQIILTHEVESTDGFGAELKWGRNYREMFEPLGFKQISMVDYKHQILRVMKKTGGVR